MNETLVSIIRTIATFIIINHFTIQHVPFESSLQACCTEASSISEPALSFDGLKFVENTCRDAFQHMTRWIVLAFAPVAHNVESTAASGRSISKRPSPVQGSVAYSTLCRSGCLATAAEVASPLFSNEHPQAFHSRYSNTIQQVR